MTFKEVAPAFLWAGLVVGVTSAVIAATWFENAIEDAYYSTTEYITAGR